MTTTLVALYDDVRTAHRVVSELTSRGFNRNDISIVARDVDEEYASYVDRDYDKTSEAAEGAGIGAVIGGIGGLLVGLGALAIPGIGPIVAAGPIVAGLTGAGIGAVAGGIVGALVDMGLPEEEAHRYAEGVRRGGTLVAAQVPDNRVDDVIEIMESYRPVDLNERTDYWRESGWDRFTSESETLTRAEIDRERARYGVNIGDGHTAERDFTSFSREGAGIDTDQRRTQIQGRQPFSGENLDDDINIDVVEEEVKIGKREVERGGVRVHTYVVERPVEEDVTLEETRVNVERRPVNRAANQADLDAFQEGTIEMTESQEELVVNKEARVTEEVHISKERRQHTERVHETERHTEVEVEELGNGSYEYNDYEPDFRRHFETNYGTSGLTYSNYSPAYRYGYELANDQRYTNRSWNDLEASARRDWADRYQSNTGAPWDDIKDAVRHGWDRVRARAVGTTNPQYEREADYRRR